MLKVFFTFVVLVSAALAQSSSDGSFSVQHAKNTNFSLKPAQMREAENLYKSACVIALHDLRGGVGELHPHFRVIIGADSNEVRGIVHGDANNGKTEIWMKKWNPRIFAQAVVVIAFDQVLTPDVIVQLGDRAIRYSDATVNVADFK